MGSFGVEEEIFIRFSKGFRVEDLGFRGGFLTSWVGI